MALEGKQRFVRADLAQLYAPTLGAEKSAETVAQAARQAAIAEGEFGPDQAFAILEILSKEKGLVALVSKLASARLRASMAMEQMAPTRAGR